MNETKTCPIAAAVTLLGGYNAAGRIVGRTGKAVRKWVVSGKLPRTEATGETTYAKQLAAAHADISESELKATAMAAPKI